MNINQKPKVGRRMLSYYGDSTAIDKLSPRAENLFTRLLPLLDDFGSYSADPVMLRLRCFPRKHNWKNQMVRQYRDELVEAGIAVLYDENGLESQNGKYIHYVKFDEHQTLKAYKKRPEVPLYRDQRLVTTESESGMTKLPTGLSRTGGDDVMQVAEESEISFPKISKGEVQAKQECRSVISVPDQDTRGLSDPDVASQNLSPVRQDIREWRQEAFGIPADRLRTCIVYQLDHAKNSWYQKNLSVSSMGHEGFVRKLDADTPAAWTPPQRLVATESGFFIQVADPTCTKCKNGKLFKGGQEYLCPCTTERWVTEKEFYGIG